MLEMGCEQLLAPLLCGEHGGLGAKPPSNNVTISPSNSMITLTQTGGRLIIYLHFKDPFLSLKISPFQDSYTGEGGFIPFLFINILAGFRGRQ